MKYEIVILYSFYFCIYLFLLTCPDCDVAFYFVSCRLHVFRKSGDFEDRLLVSSRSHDVSVSLLLNSLYGRSFGPNDEAHYAIWHSHLVGEGQRYMMGD